MISLTAQEWQLYSGMACVNQTAEEINRRLSKLIDNALGRMEKGSDAVKEAIMIRDHMFSCGTCEDWDQYGFGDTEPEQVLIEQINKHLGTEIDRFVPMPPEPAKMTESDALAIVYDLATAHAIPPNHKSCMEDEYQRQQEALRKVLQIVINYKKDEET